MGQIRELLNELAFSTKLTKDQIIELNRSFAASDADAGFEVSDEFKQFNQTDDMFTLAFWDDTEKSERVNSALFL